MVVNITLPDGSIKQFNEPITGLELANMISKSLVKAAVAIKVNQKLQDLTYVIASDASIDIITGHDDVGLDILRHDTAHILAQAVRELYPNTRIAIGPTIKDGFYYDLDPVTNFTIENLEIIEQRMQEIVRRNEKITREIWSRETAIKYFQNINEDYKVKILQDIPAREDITVYHQGDFTDLCRGPHAPTTGQTKFFKLIKLAGAYWRGDSKNKMLQRIYGTAWFTKKDLDNYLFRLKEAEKRDHRKIAQLMDLFHIQEEAQGSVFWHQNGWIIYSTLEQYIRKKLQNNGYVEVKTPIMLEQKLWEKSGHWDKFKQHMFISEADNKTLAIKPMNCPCHVQIFNQHTKSYRDLPLRMAEFGVCHRNESSGSLYGLMRVRSFVQDDAHIFCTKEQVTDEIIKFCNLVKEVYRELGFNDVSVKFSDRPKVRAGTDEVWDQAESALTKALAVANIKYTLNPGEGAFYGPKLEFILEDSIGREWQCGTLQIDYILPERLDACYIGSDNQQHRPVMLHRAILGTFERFIGILIEHYEGKFPLWLAPVQVVILTITTDVNEYADKLYRVLQRHEVRVSIDKSNQKISYKVREYSVKKVPVIWVIGQEEMQNNSVSVRRLGSDKVTNFSFEEATQLLIKEMQHYTT